MLKLEKTLGQLGQYLSDASITAGLGACAAGDKLTLWIRVFTARVQRWVPSTWP